MRILQLSELAPYLPYGVQCLTTAGVRGEMIQLSKNEVFLHCDEKWSSGSLYNWISPNTDVKPILRPLFDLTDEMSIKSGYKNATALRLMIISKRIPYLGMENLLSHHYDVFCLIKAGLAIDINTIQK